MKTIAIWYKSKKTDDSKQNLDIHINFWKLKSNALFSGFVTFIDFGFMVYDVSKIDEYYIHFPFKFSKESIYDLGGILKSNMKYVNSVFNENYDLHDSPNAAKQKSVQDNEGNCLFNIYSLDVNSDDISISHVYDGTKLIINTSTIPIANKCNKYYFRFRLSGKFISNFVKVHTPRNWFFQSAVTSIDAIDFRINEKRNYHDSLAEVISAANQYNIQKVHFLLMRDAPDDIIADHLKYNCRELEPLLWQDYVGSKYILKNIIAYHWSEKSKPDKPVESFNTLVKVKFHKFNPKTIIIYLLVIGVLSIIFNIVSSCILKEYDKKTEKVEKNLEKPELSNDESLGKSTKEINMIKGGTNEQ